MKGRLRRLFALGLWIALLAACIAPAPEEELAGDEAAGGEAAGEPSAAADARGEPSNEAPVLLEGRFAGTVTGDYNHVLVRRELGPDCDFWGYGALEESALDRLETDASLFGEPVTVAFALRETMIPEAGGELELPLTEGLAFEAGGPASAAIEDARLVEIDAVRAAAGAYVRDVTGLDMDLRIVDIGLAGSGLEAEPRAVAVALFDEHPDPAWQRGFVLLEKDGDDWRGTNYGSGLEPPPWYLCGSDAPIFAPESDEAYALLDGWSGRYTWEESGFHHGGDGDEIASGWTWTLDLESPPSGPPRGRLEIDGLQTAEAYAVRLEGDAEQVSVVLEENLGTGGVRVTGATLLTLHRLGYQVLTRLDARGPSLDGQDGTWAVRLRPL